MDFLAQLGITQAVLQFMLVAAILGLSIYLTLHTGMFSLANAGFMAIGAYVGVLLTQRAGWSLGTAVIAGMIAAGLVALPIGLPVLRLRDIYLAIATIGFSEVVRILLINFDDLVASILELLNRLWGGATLPLPLLHYDLSLIVSRPDDVRFELLSGARGIRGIPVLTQTWHMIVFLILVGYVLARLHRSRFGRAMAAVRQDEQAAANMGINVFYVKNVVFILGAMLAGAAGVFNGHLTRIITPDSYDFGLAVNILAYAVFGGTTTFLGPIIGGMMLVALPQVLTNGLPNIFENIERYSDMLNGLVLLLVIIFLPGGLINPKGWRQFIKRRRGSPSKPLADGSV